MNWLRNNPRLESPTLEAVAKLIASGRVKNIVTMVGAGISTAAGIPDFRSPSSGVYDNLQEFNLPYPMAVFTLDYFQRDPRAFFEVCRRMYHPEAKPTLTHYFIRLLHEKKLLRKHYTQNVDNLERLSGLPESKFIEAHGTFNTGHCTRCGAEYDFLYMRDQIMDKRIPVCSASSCSAVVKPDVILFGENMPRKFYANYSQDFSSCDLLIIIGTSLQVLPFCGLIHRVGSNVPRLYMNREYSQDSSTGFLNFIMRFIVAGLRRRNLQWGEPGNTRDVFVKGDCDESVLRLAELLGWKDELITLKQTVDSELTSSGKVTANHS
ncbi:NAD-dependent protein deacetylase sirtuin-2 [Fasciola gigantica]|uniref:NAD-dependent protein deacetylase n=1 Tax=Fasciola gigantica TaxID=46835 RepID=A0A504YVW4_FASGI|nr:NAD-dependent protein deacetylase sirtuin-2 [Fasciola gigantica]